MILDLHIHSKYSRACSKHLELPTIATTCETRGIDVVVTGDMTHPKWCAHMEEELEEVGEGVYGLTGKRSKTKFILGTEVAVIKKDKGKTRRVHHCLFAPDMATVRKLNKRLDDGGFNLKADGRPILGLTSKQLLELCLDVDERIELIPAHAWTPWFGVFGSKGGYDSLEEAFDELAPRIRAIETGLSSDPLMNWRCSWLDNVALVSNSDAHSPQKLGREANVLAIDPASDFSFTDVFDALYSNDPTRFKNTIEFYPEEGKYHTDGHRECDVQLTPEETAKHKGICPKCKKPLTVGVLNRVVELADRTEAEARAAAEKQGFVPYESIVPLPEILADLYSCGVATKKVQQAYDHLVETLGTEFSILRTVPIKIIEENGGADIAQAIHRVRTGDIHVVPGYDGVFGVVKVFRDDEDRGGLEQATLLD